MVQHGSANLPETNMSYFPVGTILEYRCDPGYLTDGPSTLTCTALGYWSSKPPHCIHSDGKDKFPPSGLNLELQTFLKPAIKSSTVPVNVVAHIWETSTSRNCSVPCATQMVVHSKYEWMENKQVFTTNTQRENGILCKIKLISDAVEKTVGQNSI